MRQDQQVWYLHEQVPPDLDDTPSLVATDAVCISLNSSSVNYSLDPSDFSDLQAGDLVIFVAYSNTNPDSGEIKVQPGGDYTSLGWTILMGEASSEPGAFTKTILARFAEAGDTSLNYRFVFTSVGTGIGCRKLYIYRGVSRRLPFDYLFRLEETGARRQKIMTAESRQHGNPGLWFNAILYNADSSGPVSNYDESDRASTYNVPIRVSTLGANTRRVDVIESLAYKNRAFNLFPDQDCIGGRSNTAGWGKVNVDDVDKTLSDRVVTTLGAVRDGLTKSYYIFRSMTLIAGESYYFRVRHGGKASASADEKTAWAIYTPSGDLVGARISANTDAGVGDSISGNLTAPPWRGAAGDGFSGLPDFAVAEFFIRFDCTETGVHQLRGYIIEDDDTDLEWNAGTTSSFLNDTETALFAAAWCPADYGMPVLINTTANGDPYHDDMVQPLFYEWAGSSVLRSVGTNGDGKAFQVQIIAAGQDLGNPVRLICGAWWAQRYRFNATLTGINSTDQPTRYTPSSIPSVWTPLLADRCVGPWYRLTEGGATQAGKYYWELTISSLPSSAWSNRFGWGIAPAFSRGATITNAITNSFQSMLLANGATITGDSVAQTPTTTLAPGDVIGFALDILAGTLELFKNGVSLTTLNICDDVPHFRVAYWRACAVHDSNGEGNCTWDFNFRGPFAYSKPTGYVAYDFLNEVP